MVTRSTKATTRGVRYRLITIAVLVVGALTPVSACGSNTDTHEGMTSATATGANSQDDQIALQTLDAIVRADFTAATSHFDDAMKKKLPSGNLSSSWTAYQGAFGRYQSHGDPQDVTRGDLTVVSVPLSMERKPGEFRVSMHKDETIAGLFFLEAGAPIP
ncbi:DUF3887 domain-containing protein [Nocardia anaemiae]|uniref:DUF3887 domain-containing protein n=1 Tax=Nocardia anaemiae TaxID=263910 RepID=UPI000B02FAA2|nr:DUF3887 domain-containing protein [Nocardia anaemiae]